MSGPTHPLASVKAVGSGAVAAGAGGGEAKDTFRPLRSPGALPATGPDSQLVPESTLAVVSYSTLSAIAALLGSMELLPAPPMSEPGQAELYEEILKRMARLEVLLERFVFFPMSKPDG